MISIKRAYEKAAREDGRRTLKKSAKRLTLVYGAKDPLHNHALVLKKALERA